MRLSKIGVRACVCVNVHCINKSPVATQCCHVSCAFERCECEHVYCLHHRQNKIWVDNSDCISAGLHEYLSSCVISQNVMLGHKTCKH